MKLSHICMRIPPLTSYGNDFAYEDIFNVIQDVAPTVDEIMLSCSWKGTNFNCSEYLQPVLTNDGVCFTFNALNSRDIYTDE